MKTTPKKTQHLILAFCVLATATALPAGDIVPERANVPAAVVPEEQALQGEHVGEHGHHHLISYTERGNDWGETENPLCESGKLQSPISIDTKTSAEACNPEDFCGEPIEFDYSPTNVTSVVNNGHTVQVNFAEGNSFSVCNETFPLVQLHFHSKSEDELDGERTPMEMHLVHKNPDLSEPYAVIGVLLQPGTDNKAQGVEQLFGHSGAGRDCEYEDCTEYDGDELNPLDFLPDNKVYYRFQGSFTTPPCTEGVRWFELAEKGSIHADDVKAFRDDLEFAKGSRSPAGNHDDYRSIQSSNGRTVCTGGGEPEPAPADASDDASQGRRARQGIQEAKDVARKQG